MHGHLRDRIEALRSGAAFRNYEFVRDRVVEMRAIEARMPEHTPSAYWQEELSMFEYMLDATPLIVDRLRHHTEWITGVRPYEYRSNRDRHKQKMARKLKELLKHGRRELLVPEWRPLGGFGFEIDGDLYNIDTFKYFEVLIALEKGAVLEEFRHGSDRRLVWEIGAGWGGFPYQFKTICPNVTYVITDFPELFLYSATYLMTAFPDAKVRFWGQEPTDRILANWCDYDFVFLPNTALDEMKPERLDLAVNMVSFQEMTQAQVDAYVEHAFTLNAPFVYSLNRERSSYNTEIESVSSAISKYYWPRQIDVLRVPYTRMMDDEALPNDYRHIIGWRRTKV